MKHIVNKPVIEVDYKKLEESGIAEKELDYYISRYILYPTILKCGIFTRFLNLIIQFFIQVGIWIFLKPRKSKPGSLDQAEVDKVYSKEAITYNQKHHLTTRGQDLVWRRQAAQLVSAVAKSKKGELIKVLDICTGTGLTIEQILIELEKSGLKADITGLDYNADMLSVARGSIDPLCVVSFLRWDATKLLQAFLADSTDVITQVFGIGGVPDPLDVFPEVLGVLKPGGKFIMIDMHKPVPEFPGELPFLFLWLRTPVLEAITYEQTTIPLALKRLWGWRDTTALFYLLPLVVYCGSAGTHWGFEIECFEHQSERWWLSLPVMPTAKIIVKKVEISPEEFKIRQGILNACKYKF